MPTFTPEELKKIAPDEYRRIYGDDKPEKPEAEAARMNAEARRLEAEARLLNAKRRKTRAELNEDKKPRRSLSPAWWVALAVAIAQFIFTWYIIAKY